MDRTALVVEDDTSLRTIYRRVLQEEGYTVLEATNGVEAMHILETQPPHILFLDILLPEVNGLKVLEYIAETPALAHLSVIIVSSNKKFEQYKTIVPDAQFILKPIRPGVIRDLVNKLPA